MNISAYLDKASNFVLRYVEAQYCSYIIPNAVLQLDNGVSFYKISTLQLAQQPKTTRISTRGQLQAMRYLQILKSVVLGAFSQGIHQ